MRLSTGKNSPPSDQCHLGSRPSTLDNPSLKRICSRQFWLPGDLVGFGGCRNGWKSGKGGEEEFLFCGRWCFCFLFSSLCVYVFIIHIFFTHNVYIYIYTCECTYFMRIYIHTWYKYLHLYIIYIHLLLRLTYQLKQIHATSSPAAARGERYAWVLYESAGTGTTMRWDLVPG